MALEVSTITVASDQGLNLAIQTFWQDLVLHRNPILQGLLPPFDLVLGLEMVGCSPNIPQAPWPAPTLVAVLILA
jgi:hypothetical protein